MEQALLTCTGVKTFYGESQALYGVDLAVLPGETVALLGRNGMGKTTLIRSIMGQLPPREGDIRFAGQLISGLRPHRIARAGIALVPQGREIFSDLTVAENLRLGRIAAGRDRQVPEQIFRYFPVLRERMHQKGGSLSGGQQQILAIGRALCAEPRLLLLDEPTEGIQPSIVASLRRELKQINQELGLSILLVEQKLAFALALADRVYILEKGRVVFSGTAAELSEAELQKHLAI